MSRKVVVLESAKQDFVEVKRYIRNDFGEHVWNAINLEYKTAIRQIREHPHLGSQIDDLLELGIRNIRYILVRQTRIVYEYDDELVLIHMFIHTRRNFRTQLFQRIGGAPSG
ncbi:type II toxin-antitoxin system RelE/ParE family toxin [Pseudoduganella danionis]|uniref:Type II toxin-antitoxin system RelE/ParE family toxin n=1 Tax=Pseudoduganella danionis TaxID=1890295 RepID=A0ABW9SLJ3_9BURK|nr:hypothetical protein [Pseudoduganella danionis]